ncbi:hypothetical protein V6Z12_A01G043900 [Gossypium hirsutum]
MNLLILNLVFILFFTLVLKLDNFFNFDLCDNMALQYYVMTSLKFCNFYKKNLGNNVIQYYSLISL